MARLTGKERKELPKKDFAVPGRKFPIENKSHARDALARSADKAPGVKAEVRRAVEKRFPQIDKTKEKRS
jgi:hypothetical protein